MKFKIAVGVAILSVIGLGISSAAIPDSTTGVITACRSSIGQLRVIDKQAGASCTVYGETEMSWNQAGPAGATGATGATGPQGATGATGATGMSGYERQYYGFSPTIPANGPSYTRFLFAACSGTKKVVGGGYGVYPSDSGWDSRWMPLSTGPADQGAAGWMIVFSEEDFVRNYGSVSVYAICVNAS